MGEPILIFCLGISGILAYSYIRQMVYKRRQRQEQAQLQHQRIQVRSVLNVPTNQNQPIPPKYEDIVNREQAPPNYEQAILNV